MENEIRLRLEEMSKKFAQYDKDSYWNHSLLTGMSGLLLFQLYYQRFIDKPNEKLEETLVDMITEEIQSPISSTTFCNGTAGFAWFLNHLNTEGFIELDPSLFLQYDELLYDQSLLSLEEENHDYLHGGLGQMIYLIARLKDNPTLHEKMDVLVDKLIDLADQDESGIYWKESLAMLEEDEKHKEVINLHLSHGQASKIMLFVKLIEAGYTKIEPVLRAAIQYLLANKITNGDRFIIPDRIVDTKKNPFTHLGWCRGNLSISLSLLNAAKVLNNSSLKEEAEQIAAQTLEFDTMEKAGIRDFAMCHGTAGLSHMYSRVFEHTNSDRFETAAERWMEYTLNASFEGGTGQFKSWNAISKEWIDDPGMLSGASGIGLALIGYLSPENRLWDASFLLS